MNIVLRAIQDVLIERIATHLKKVFKREMLITTWILRLSKFAVILSFLLTVVVGVYLFCSIFSVVDSISVLGYQDTKIITTILLFVALVASFLFHMLVWKFNRELPSIIEDVKCQIDNLKTVNGESVENKQ